MHNILATLLVLSISAQNGLVLQLISTFYYTVAQSVSPPPIAGNYLVAIRVNNTKVYETDVNWFNCGGSIIDDRFTITAARCFINEENDFEKLHLTVLAGVQDLLYKTESTRVEIDVEKVYVPGNYHSGRFNPWNDLVVVKLNKSLDSEHNQGLRKLRLPERTRSSKVVDKAIIGGFGIEWLKGIHLIGPLENDSTLASVVHGEDGKIHSGAAEMADNSKCELANNGISCIRVVKSDKDEQCMGDSGGPLVHESDVLISASPQVNCISRRMPEIAGLYFEFVNTTDHIDFTLSSLNDNTTNMRTHVY